MRTTVFVLLAVFVLAHPCHSFSDREAIAFWLTEISNGVFDLKHPHFPEFHRPEYRDYIHSLIGTKEPEMTNFSSFIRATEKTTGCWFAACSEDQIASESCFFDSKTLPSEVISGVFNRRVPIINSFVYDHEKYRGPDPKYICHATANSYYDYLGLVQIRLVIILIVSSDFRFAAEAENLLRYLQTPFTKGHNWWERRDHEAFLCYSSDTRDWLPVFVKKYIEVCKKHGNAR